MKMLTKLTYILIIALASLSLVSACSKESNTPKGKKGGEKPSVVIKASDTFSQDKNSLKAVRNGQYVALNWQIDATGMQIKQIEVLRNNTGINKKKKVGILEPSAASFKDSLPDENAYWYWIGLVMADGKSREIGPVRVNMDSAGAANYVKFEDIYKTSITRTDNLATLKWDFPEGDYKEIRIFRFTRPVAELFKGPVAGKGKTKGMGSVVTTSMERKSQCPNTLPDSDSDYWYWFRIIMKSGAIIEKGPVKAEYNIQGKSKTR